MAVGYYARKEICLVLRTDDAIADHTRDEEGALQSASYNAYLKAHYDVSKLELKKGHIPTKFYVKRINRNARERVRAFEDGDPARTSFLVRCGLVRLVGFKVYHEDGETEIPPVTHEESSQYGLMVTQKWLNDADLPPFIEEFLAASIDALSQAQLPFSPKSDTPSTDGG